MFKFEVIGKRANSSQEKGKPPVSYYVVTMSICSDNGLAQSGGDIILNVSKEEFDSVDIGTILTLNILIPVF